MGGFKGGSIPILLPGPLFGSYDFLENDIYLFLLCVKKFKKFLLRGLLGIIDSSLSVG